jgi:hypothetical protein
MIRTVAWHPSKQEADEFRAASTANLLRLMEQDHRDRDLSGESIPTEMKEVAAEAHEFFAFCQKLFTGRMCPLLTIELFGIRLGSITVSLPGKRK